jgi:hypothetical protein
MLNKFPFSLLPPLRRSSFSTFSFSSSFGESAGTPWGCRQVVGRGRRKTILFSCVETFSLQEPAFTRINILPSVNIINSSRENVLGVGIFNQGSKTAGANNTCRVGGEDADKARKRRSGHSGAHWGSFPHLKPQCLLGHRSHPIRHARFLDIPRWLASERSVHLTQWGAERVESGG